MLNANHGTKSSMASRALGVITFVALITLAAVIALLSRDAVVDAKAPAAQDKNPVGAAPAQFENLPDIPLVITDVRLSLSELRVIKHDPYREAYNPTLGMTVRDVKFVVDLVNQSDHNVEECMAQIQYATSLEKKPVTPALLRFIRFRKDDKQVKIGPKEIFRFETQIPLQDIKGDLSLTNLPYNFNIRITGVKFESDGQWLLAEPGKTPGAYRKMIPVVSPLEDYDKDYVEQYIANQDQITNASIQPMSASLRPTILYREKAQYAWEAKDNKIEGKVILSVLFGADGKLSDIKALQELPFDLTENAIAAAKKIRFKPAVKDGQPVSVRGMLEFTFIDGDVYPKTHSLQARILYKGKAQYTQEAKDKKIQGTVVLSVIYGADGQLRDIRVIQGLPYGLTEKAIEAAKKIRFMPALENGQPVNVRENLEFTFTLH